MYAREKSKARKPAPLPAQIAIVADCHIGNHKAYGGEMVDGINSRCAVSIACFRSALRRARAEGASMFVVAGDLFHTRRPEPAVIAAVQRVLQEEAAELQVVMVPGNHDMLDASAAGGNTAMAPLYREATVILEPTWIEADSASLFCVPFFAGAPMSEYLAEMMPAAGAARCDVDRPKLLVTHVGVYDDLSPPWCAVARDAIHEDKFKSALIEGGFAAAFVGNFHNGQIFGGGRILQIGTLCPGSYGDSGAFPKVGGMALWPSASLLAEPRLVEIQGPRFTDDPAEVKPDSENSYFMREVVTEERAEDKPALPQAQDAMSAIAEYVAAMKLPDGVSADQVLEAARGYWQRS